ncbi:cytochrome b/b6 domain-containing protein [Streptomyces sp. NPDC059697]|uniref:cytochrome b/b6 domain-containing protein n=1 Tax=Streptomyces sp. NPDC059697 TaxID=3346912 RepID=UPI003694EC30
MPDDEHVTGDGALPHASGASSQTPGGFRSNLTRGDDVVDVATWAGSIPAASGVAPRVRLGSRWFNLLWLLPIGFVGLLGCVAAAKGLQGMPSVQRFIAEYPGTVPRADRDGASLGVPSWARWSHFFNLFFMLFTLRSGLQILADHPRLYWTRHSTPGREWFRMQKPVSADPLWTAKQDSIGLPRRVGLPGIRHSIGLARWWHLGVNTLWLLNGLVFYVLLFATPQWKRLVPTSWSVFPNAASVAIQYLSLNWPRENGWVAYNGLQLLAYFVTVFVAAPLALITGLGMSPALSTRFKRLSRVLSIQTARSVHFLVFTWFVLFIVIHVSLVFTTGLLTNLNHIDSGRNDSSWLGLWIFLGWMAVVVAAWVAATPLTLRHPRVVQRVGYALIGPAQRLFEHVDVSPGEYTEKDISPYFWHNGRQGHVDGFEDFHRCARSQAACWSLSEPDDVDDVEASGRAVDPVNGGELPDRGGADILAVGVAAVERREGPRVSAGNVHHVAQHRAGVLGQVVQDGQRLRGQSRGPRLVSHRRPSRASARPTPSESSLPEARNASTAGAASRRASQARTTSCSGVRL